MRKSQLDGLRFVLFLCVFGTHHFPERLEFLGYALPVFFVMSGFLITKVLLSADDPSLAGRLRVFYVRRILRICPAYYVVVALLLVLGWVSYPYHYLGYLVNIKLFALSLDPNPQAFNAWFSQAWRSESWHLWSLSVEEQFYIVYPLVLYLTAARIRVAMLFVLLIASIAARVWLAKEYPHSFYGALLPVSAEYFVWGCLFACFELNGRLGRLDPAKVAYAASSLVLTLIFTEFYFNWDGVYQFRTSHFQTPIAVLLGFAVWGLWAMREDSILVRTLRWRPFVYFGEMSYTMYLTHLMTWNLYSLLGFDRALPGKSGLVLGTFVLTVLISMAIWHLVEQPVNGLKRYIPYAKPASMVT